MKNSANKEEKVYFPNLNGLRAIGACIVMVGHVEFLKLFWHMPAFQWFPVPGKIGVSLFFALSGFLITSLLLQELRVTHFIQLKKFYLRRILRIWPLYYLVIVLSLFVFNQVGFFKVPAYSDQVYQNLTMTNILLLIFLLPNITHFYIPYADQRWSIVVEEQFYLFQPLILRIFKKRRRLFFVFLFIIFSPEITSFIIRIFHLEKIVSANIIESLTVQLKYLACIAVGCLFSVLYFKTENFSLKWLFSRLVQWAVVIILIICVFLGHYILNTEETIDFRLYTFLFAIVVLNASRNPDTIFNFETPFLNFLGKISYGIYMYHPICIGTAIALASLVTKNVIFQNVVIYSLAFPFTIFVAWFSYKYFEEFFLKLKSRLQIIKTKKKVELSELNEAVVNN